MDESDNSDDLERENHPVTAPETFGVQIRAFDSSERATSFGQILGVLVRELSRYIKLSTLDGITVAFDYNQALIELDRGYDTSHQLTPSDEYAIGVAMTPAVIRDGEIKSHIVLNANYVLALENIENEEFQFALHVVAHECAHVEVTGKFNSAFPGVLLQRKCANTHEGLTWKIISSCWDEYAATWISASIGQDPTVGYEDTFIQILSNARSQANGFIKEYRLHGDVNRVLSEVYDVYGSLLLYASYHLGNMAGKALSVADLPKTSAALDGHWFKKYFERLEGLCKALADNYGNWNDLDQFEAIGSLADDVILEGGLKVSLLDDGGLYVDVPYTQETLPD